MLPLVLGWSRCWDCCWRLDLFDDLLKLPIFLVMTQAKFQCPKSKLMGMRRLGYLRQVPVRVDRLVICVVLNYVLPKGPCIVSHILRSNAPLVL